MTTRREPAACEIAVVILTLNEEVNLRRCLESVSSWAHELFVVDAGSTDRTREIAESLGATVVEHTFETHSVQWRWALDNLPIQSPWVLALDADQRVTTALANELRHLSAAAVSGVDGIYIKRQQWFRGRWIRHGGYYPKYLLKLFRPGAVLIDATDLVDHHFYVAGRVQKLRHDLIESNRKEDDISFWIHKHNRYATLLAQEETRAHSAPFRRGSTAPVIAARVLGTPDQRALAFKQWWRQMPLYLRPFAYFIYRYFLRLGFLDGKQGAIFHFLQAFWFRLLVDIAIDDIRRATNGRDETGDTSLTTTMTGEL